MTLPLRIRARPFVTEPTSISQSRLAEWRHGFWVGVMLTLMLVGTVFSVAAR